MIFDDFSKIRPRSIWCSLMTFMIFRDVLQYLKMFLGAQNIVKSQSGLMQPIQDVRMVTIKNFGHIDKITKIHDSSLFCKNVHR